MFKSLRFRLSIIFISLAIGPLLFATFFLTRNSVGYLEQQSQDMLHEVAIRVGNEVRFFIEDQINNFELIQKLSTIELLPPEKQKILFSNLLFDQQIYQDIALLNPDGQELIRLSRSAVFTDKDLQNKANKQEFLLASTHKRPHFSRIYFDKEIQEPLLTIAIPLVNLRSGELAYVFIGELRFKRIWELLANITIPGKGLVYVIDKSNQVVAHRNPSVVLSGTTVNLPEVEGRAKGLSRTDVIVSWDLLEFGSQQLTVVVEQPLSLTLELITNYFQIAATVTFFLLLIVLPLVILAIRYFIRPIELMAIAARAISNGDYSQHIIVHSQDELGYLASSFNRMMQDLERYSNKMEELVKTRTLEVSEQKEQIQAITENVPGVVFQFYASNAGELGVHYISPKVCDIFDLEFIDNPPLFLQTFVQKIHEKDRRSWTSSAQEAIDKQIPWRWKGRYVKPSGEIVWFEVRSKPTVRKDEIVLNGILTDITMEKEQEVQRLEATRQQEQLKKLESLKTMAGAIAHRFNNAMMAVKGNLELMKFTLPADSNEYKMATDAAQAASGASQVGSMMLSYVGQQPLNLHQIPLETLTRECVTSLKNLLPPSITLQFTPPDRPLYCSSDQKQIKEVLKSILTNAIESLGENTPGTIEITFGTDYFTSNSFPMCFQSKNLQDRRYVFCQIKDTGHGIDPKDLSLIFEPFYTTRFVGRGLGLALTVGIMQAHHGAITVESILEKGTTVRVLLPSTSSAQQTPSFSDEILNETVQFTGNILLADDEEMILDVGRKMLEMLGFTIHTAINGQEAVEMIRGNDIDFCAVVLDISMPEMDGIEAMNVIREMKPTLPIILSSGYSEDAFPFTEGEKNKPDAFLGKPFQLSDMRNRIKKLLS